MLERARASRIYAANPRLQPGHLASPPPLLPFFQQQSLAPSTLSLRKRAGRYDAIFSLKTSFLDQLRSFFGFKPEFDMRQ
eukprot:6015922-Pleurochrysis_carterae.AAC.1